MVQIKALYKAQRDSLEGPQEAEAIKRRHKINCETFSVKIKRDI